MTNMNDAEGQALFAEELNKLGVGDDKDAAAFFGIASKAEAPAVAAEPEVPVSEPEAEPAMETEEPEAEVKSEAEPESEPEVIDADTGDDDLPEPIPAEAPSEAKATDKPLTVEGLAALIKAVSAEGKQGAENAEAADADEGVGVLESADVKAILERIEGSPVLQAAIERRVAESLREERVKANTAAVQGYLDTEFPAVQRYLNSQQYTRFINSDAGGGQFTVGASYGDVLKRAMLEGDTKSAGSVIDTFLRGLRGEKPKRVNPAKGGAATGRVQPKTVEAPKKPDLNAQLEALDRQMRDGTLSRQAVDEQLAKLFAA